MLLGEGDRKYSYDTDNVLDFIMSFVHDYWLGVLKLAIFWGGQIPIIAQMLMIFFPVHSITENQLF